MNVFVNCSKVHFWVGKPVELTTLTGTLHDETLCANPLASFPSLLATSVLRMRNIDVAGRPGNEATNPLKHKICKVIHA